jgi:hypothetical protein
MLAKLSFKNPNAGRQTRAAFYLRWARLARRKRVAYARAHVADTMAHLARQIARYEALATTYDVPVARVGPLPVIPLMPGPEWVEFRQWQGELKQPVKPAPIGQPETA